MHPMLNIAIRAARKAGDFIAKSHENADSVETLQKGTYDFVTNIDKGAEAIIIDVIKKSYPDHAFVAEESGSQATPRATINGLSTHWMAPLTSLTVCLISLCLSHCVSKAAPNWAVFTTQCATNCSPLSVVQVRS